MLSLLALSACGSAAPQAARVSSVQKDRMILETKEHIFFVNLSTSDNLKSLVKKGDSVTLVRSSPETISQILLENGTQITLE